LRVLDPNLCDPSHHRRTVRALTKVLRIDATQTRAYIIEAKEQKK